MTDPVLPRGFVVLHCRRESVYVRPELIDYYHADDHGSSVWVGEHTIGADEPPAAIAATLCAYDRMGGEFAVFLRMLPHLRLLAMAKRVLDAAQPVERHVREAEDASRVLASAQDELVKLALTMPPETD